MFNFRGCRRFVSFNGVLFTQEIPNEIILLCMDYGAAHKLEKKNDFEEQHVLSDVQLIIAATLENNNPAKTLLTLRNECVRKAWIAE